LIAVSCLLYAAGMVLNDVFDYEEDCRERPERPLPSSRVSRRAAAWFGAGLMATALLVAVGASVWNGNSLPFIVACVLAWFIFMYDYRLSRNMAGPVGLGACRMVNVFLGACAAHPRINVLHPEPWAIDYLIIVIGLFVMGVSVLARGEAKQSARATILLGIVLMMVAVGLLWWLPEVRPIVVPTRGWHLFVVLMTMLVAWRCYPALVDPAPAVVQRLVGQSLRALVVLDAAIALATAGIVPGVAILLLLVPNVLLSRWFYST
jgi:4-hydroxybenzoate polyprenyltransferase